MYSRHTLVDVFFQGVAFGSHNQLAPQNLSKLGMFSYIV